MNIVSFCSTILMASFILVSRSYAYEYQPDDAACLKHHGSICAEIDISEFKHCSMDRFIWDERKNIIGINNQKEQKIVNEILVEDKLNIGCQHYSKSTAYHFNKKIDTRNVTCESVVDIWSEIRKETGSSALKCTAQEPDKMATMNMIGLHCSFVAEESCSKGNMSEGIDFGQSDLEDYDFFIKETTGSQI